MPQESKIIPTSKVAFAPRKRHPSKYAEIFAGMKKLRVGESIWVVCGWNNTTSARALRNRLNAALSRTPITPPRGCVFRKRITDTGDLAICCERKKAGKK